MTSLYRFLLKYGTLMALLLAIVVVIVFIIDFTTGLRSAGMSVSTDLVPHAKTIGFFNITLYLSLFILFIAAILWILVEGINLGLNPKGSLKFLAGIAALVVLYIIFYYSASGAEGGRLAELIADPAYNMTPIVSKHVSAGLWTTFTLFLLSVIAFVGSEIIAIFK